MSGVQVTLRVGAERYAFPVHSVLEVSEVGRLTPVPGAPAGTLGLTNLHGSLLPVFDLALMLGLPREGQAARLVVVENGAIRAGLAVDDVCDVSELPAASQETASPFLVGAALIDDGLVGLVDVGRLLDGLQGGASRD
jgi:purine-binding chemotaxis protein CheW